MRLYDFGIVILLAGLAAAVALGAAGIIVANSTPEEPPPVSAPAE
jgi:hypothetical protein